MDKTYEAIIAGAKADGSWDKKYPEEEHALKMTQDYLNGWNNALDEAAARIGEIKGFGKATQDSFAIYIRGLKR